MNQEVAPYGSWKSPITTDLIVKNIVRLGQIVIDCDDIYWLEGLPEEGGRYVIVRLTADGKREDVIPPDFNVRTRVHEYGGGEYLVHEEVVYFSNFTDQRFYKKLPDKKPEPMTPAVDLRYADGVMDIEHDRIICIREDHRNVDAEPVNTIISISPISENEGRVLVSGNDFYSSPRISPDGNQLAWLTWNHPNMPWDETELWVGDIVLDGTIENHQKIAGGKKESIFQVEWSPDGIPYFISDKSNWWNLYRFKDGKIENLYEMDAEFGVPQWRFGLSTYGFLSRNEIVCTYTKDGIWYIGILDVENHNLKTLDIPYTDIYYLKVSKDYVLFMGGSPDEPTSIIMLDIDSGETSVLKRSVEVSIDSGYLSEPEPITFETECDKKSYGLFYPPKNKDYKAPEGELPPLIVISHGGPTSATVSTLSMAIQYWTSRGFAVLDVNYGGSTGYGREYRERLKGNWGIVDVDDCINGAKYLARRGDIDGARVIIRGGSAGGYTTLSALTFHDYFKAGASYYGVSDLEALTRETHKFESRYLDSLVGPYPERKDIYNERSPINLTESLSSPVIFFQGLEDKVVLPNQAESMVDALKKKGIPVAYIPFEGEQHGFRRAENIKRSSEAELYFYSKVFGFEISDEIKPVEIENL
jgi:dipeptidyl aminopeptidase/acylaminoacyl peptidase